MNKEEQKDKKKKRVETKELFEEIVGGVKDNFVAIYETEQSTLIIRMLNGQKFRLSLEEIS